MYGVAFFPFFIIFILVIFIFHHQLNTIYKFLSFFLSEFFFFFFKVDFRGVAAICPVFRVTLLYSILYTTNTNFTPSHNPTLGRITS